MTLSNTFRVQSISHASLQKFLQHSCEVGQCDPHIASIGQSESGLLKAIQLNHSWGEI